jgi:hypothetical protein
MCRTLCEWIPWSRGASRGLPDADTSTARIPRGLFMFSNMVQVFSRMVLSCISNFISKSLDEILGADSDYQSQTSDQP